MRLILRRVSGESVTARVRLALSMSKTAWRAKASGGNGGIKLARRRSADLRIGSPIFF
jgi:hypothetical protein